MLANNQRLDRHFLTLPQVLDIGHIRPLASVSIAVNTAALPIIANRSMSTSNALLASLVSSSRKKKKLIVSLLTHNYIKVHYTGCS